MNTTFHEKEEAENMRPLTNEDVIASIMYLCAQPEVAKEIRKLWPKPRPRGEQ